MKPGLVSPDFLLTFGFTFRKHIDNTAKNISETAISDTFKKSNVFIKSSMILRTFNAVLKFTYETILFDCSGAFSPTFRHCNHKVRRMS